MHAHFARLKQGGYAAAHSHAHAFGAARNGSPARRIYIYESSETFSISKKAKQMTRNQSGREEVTRPAVHLVGDVALPPPSVTTYEEGGRCNYGRGSWRQRNRYSGHARFLTCFCRFFSLFLFSSRGGGQCGASESLGDVERNKRI